MATTSKGKASSSAPKRQPGRPKKAPSEKLEQFSIRLPPKMKFGLELLARAQHRSLSQSVEWALQVGLNSHAVNQDATSVADLMDKAWEAPTSYQRALAIYDAAPSLCDFEDYNGCLLADRSRERAEIFDYVRGIEEQRYAEYLYTQFVALYWEDIKKEAAELSSKGKDLSNRLLMVFLGLNVRSATNPTDILETLRRAIIMKGASPIRKESLPPPKAMPF